MRIFVERYTIAALMGTEYDDGSAPVSGELADKVARDLKSGLAVIEREYGAALGRTTDADLRDVLSVDYARLGLVALGEVLEDRP